MRKRLKSLVKYIQPLYRLYNKCGNIGMKILSIFVKTDNKLILFVCYGGKKYDDSPKVLYEAMKKDKRFRGYKFVWAFENPERYPNIELRIKIDTLRYFLTALKARVWITNSTIERGLNFKGKNTFYFDTWHGTPIKKMGSDISADNKSFRSNGRFQVDVMTAQGDFESDIFSRVFEIKRDKFLLCGLPRNDELFSYSEEQKNVLREKLGIPKGKKAILYMPTFREFDKNLGQECILTPPIDLKKWEKALNKDYVFLFRAHYEVSRIMNIKSSGFVKNVTSYPVLNELMIASDILISDYSSSFFDYSIMNKPMFYFTYDYNQYSKERGMYFDIREELNGADNEEKLINMIQYLDYKTEIEKTKVFRAKYVNYYGSATKQSLDCIYKNLKKS